MNTHPVAIITGGASGIGNACAKAFTDTHHVIVADLKNAHEAAKEIGPNATGMDLNIADYESCEKLAQKASKLGPITTLVNCAGICPETYKIGNLPLELWKKVMSVNLDGTFFITRAFMPYFEEGGSIVLIASRAGRTGISARKFDEPTHADYATSKAAVISFTKSLAFELAPRKIRVNAITPGPVLTPLQLKKRNATEIGVSVPLGRAGEPADIIPAIQFLCSAGASWITGHTLDINGGMTM